MEGPSLFLAQEQLEAFCNKTIQAVSGNTKIGKEKFLNRQIRELFSWGKHLVFQFDTFGFRVHFLLFGTFSATVEGKSVTGDYQRKSREPRLRLDFENGFIEMYNCSIKIIEDEAIREGYDFSIDVMSDQWDEDQALKKIKAQPREEVADVLLDQEIFAGVGNIIKNEVLWLTTTHPKKEISELSPEKLVEVIACAVRFSHQFYEWRKIFQLKKNLQIYRKSVCPRCGTKVIREKTGTRQRWSYYCPQCQR